VTVDVTLVVAATRAEAAYVPRDLPVVVTGIGRTAAAVATTRALVGMDPARTLVVNVGTWSSTSPTTPTPLGTRERFCGRLSYRRDAVRGKGGGRSPGPLETEETAMTHYLLSVHGPVERSEFGSYGSREEMEEAFAATGAFNERLRAEGYWVFAGGLAPASTATVVDGQGRTPVMSDGPYLETKEVIGGFWVIDAPDLDVALALAAAGSQACRGAVEVRPFEGLA
jgi:hypothetical protein